MEHNSINCANEAKARGASTMVQLACLLHDGSEAYISDITRPLKKHLPRYVEIEETLQDAIYKKLLASLPTDEEHALVKQLDDDMLACEFNTLMDKKVFRQTPDIKSKPFFTECDFQAVENMFLRLARSLMDEKNPITVLGIDGCRGGWCVVKLDSLGNSSMQLIKGMNKLSRQDADIAIIDIPIGLSDSGEERPFDIMVKERLGKRRNSVFPVPCRSAVYESADSYEKACENNEKITGKRISRQSWALVPKIREVDMFLRDNPQMQNFILENHPELCFAQLRGRPCEYHKSMREGERERITVLRKHMDILNLLCNPPYSENGVEAERDDILDAAVLAVAGLNMAESNNDYIFNSY